jgi:hypothetical protein
VRSANRWGWPAAVLLLAALAEPMTAQAQLGPFERLVMPGPLARAHAEFESKCASCHVRFERQSQQQLCLDCHEPIADDLAAHTGFHGKSPDVQAADGGAACARCHTEHEGRDADILGLDRAGFDHDLTEFPLLGSHVDADCEGCHSPAQPFHDAERDCIACHVDDDRHLGNLGRQCADCHEATRWTDTHFDHGAEAGYVLTGAHGTVRCMGCHAGEQYADTSDQCVSCHMADDVHEGTNGAQCQSCHATADWTDVSFDHFTATGFALAGGHADIDCESCHTGNKFEETTPTECNGCHLEDDVHHGVNGPTCGDCHRTTKWLDVTFDHDADTDFALHGAHEDIECADCHVEPVDVALPGKRCVDCHADDDPHEDQLGQRCDTCHGEQSFSENLRFDHDLTRFPLLGRHQQIDCDDCHASQAFLDAPGQCVDCHAEDDAHDRRLGTDCGLCHNPNDWQLTVFDHDMQTDFPLDGAHAAARCTSCHREPLDATPALATDCGSCHRADDVHDGEFGEDCGRCHTTTSFAELGTVR